MSEEFESVDEIKARMISEPKGEAIKVDETSEQEPNDIVNNEEKPQLSLKDRLDNAYQNLDNTEKEAWSQGWRPQEFDRGKRRDGTDRPHLSAEDFLKKSKDALPVANDRLREMARELEETKKIAKDAQERILKAERNGYQKALDDLEAKQREAVEMGDLDEFNKLKQSEKDLVSSQVKQLEVVQDAMEQQPASKVESNTLSELDQQILQDWAARNNWMRTDSKLAGFAIAAEKELLDQKPYLSLSERLQLVEEEVKEVFYNKFSTPQTNSMFESGVNKGFGSTPKEKGYSDLSPEIKKQCETLIKIRGVTGEDAIKRFKANYAKNIN